MTSYRRTLASESGSAKRKTMKIYLTRSNLFQEEGEDRNTGEALLWTVYETTESSCAATAEALREAWPFSPVPEISEVCGGHGVIIDLPMAEVEEALFPQQKEAASE